MRHLPENQRWLAIGLLQGGSTQADVARQLNVSQSVISRSWNRHQQTGNVIDIHRVGRPRATTRQQDRLLVTSTLRNTPACHTPSAPTLPGYRGAGL